MQRFHHGKEIGPLTIWPFDNPQSDYQILRGHPVASGRIDHGGPGHATRHGIWACTSGAFSCIEQGDEMMTILSGQGTVTDVETGNVTPFAPGDTLFSYDGTRVKWDITQDVVKVFFGHKESGF